MRNRNLVKQDKMSAFGRRWISAFFPFNCSSFGMVVREIRYTRVKKFGRKKQWRSVWFSLAFVCYLTIITSSYAVSYTGAGFSKAVELSGVISTAQSAETTVAENKSLLKWLHNKEQNINACERTEIFATIQNAGGTMSEMARYEVYYSEHDNPTKGEKVATGNIPKLKNNGEFQLKYLTEKFGNYQFRILQPFLPDGQKDLWSNTFHVLCSQQDLQEKNELKDAQLLNYSEFKENNSGKEMKEKEPPLKEQTERQNGGESIENTVNQNDDKQLKEKEPDDEQQLLKQQNQPSDEQKQSGHHLDGNKQSQTGSRKED